LNYLQLAPGWFGVRLSPKFRSIAEKKVIAEAERQVAAAEAHGLTVEWLVSEQTAATELQALFNAKGIKVKVTHLKP
jgi:hypothetical protein